MTNKRLETLQDIASHLQWSEDKVLAVKDKHPDFPIRKILGRWTSHTQVLDQWFQLEIVSIGKTS